MKHDNQVSWEPDAILGIAETLEKIKDDDDIRTPDTVRMRQTGSNGEVLFGFKVSPPGDDSE